MDAHGRWAETAGAGQGLSAMAGAGTGDARSPYATGTAAAHSAPMTQKADAPRLPYSGPLAKVRAVDAAPTATVP